MRSYKTTLLLLLAPSSTLLNLKEEVASALNDTAETQRNVSPDDVNIYKRKGGQWSLLDQEDKGGKRTREATLEDLDIRGVGAGSIVDDDGEILGYTVKNGLEEEQRMEVEAYPRED